MAADVPKADLPEAPQTMTLPPLSLSTGPAVSGGGSISTPLSTGDFSINTNAEPSALQSLTSALPMIAIAAVALVLLINR